MSTLLKLEQVVEKTTLSSTEIYRRISSNKFPKPRQLSKKRVAWLEEDIENWIKELPAANDPGQE